MYYITRSQNLIKSGFLLQESGHGFLLVMPLASYPLKS